MTKRLNIGILYEKNQYEAYWEKTQCLYRFLIFHQTGFNVKNLVLQLISPKLAPVEVLFGWKKEDSEN